MTKLNKQGKQTAAVVAALIILAVVCRMLGYNGFHKLLTGLIRSGIYIFLFAAWSVSLQNRIMQRWQRRYMTGIAASMVFWFLVRTLKFHFIPEETMPDVIRALWYCYYIPMLLIPMLSLFTAVSLGKPEQYRPPRRLHLLWIPTLLLILTVLTNDLHQTVFVFSAAYPVWTDSHCSYGPMYWVVMLWILLCAALALGIIFRKCRLPHSKKILWLPLLLFCLIIVYALLYITVFPIIKPLLGDMTATSCVLIALIFESCIQCGLIQSNSHYAELFRTSAIAAQITDRDLNVCYAAQDIHPVERKSLEQARQEAVILNESIRLCAEPIRDGYVFWQEDVSELLSVLNVLGDTRDELQEYSHLLDEENRQKKRRRELEERKRLYDAVQRKVFPQIKRMEELIDQLRIAEDTASAKALHGKIAVTGAYLKRRSNLVFLADQTGQVDTRELFLCLNESVSNLRLAGVSCGLRFDLDGGMDGEAAGMLYDFFEAAVECAYDALTGMNVAVTPEGVGYHILLMLRCDTDLSALGPRFPWAVVEQDEDICYCRLTAKGVSRYAPLDPQEQARQGVDQGRAGQSALWHLFC